MSEILGNKEVSIYGNGMRKIRNAELYNGGLILTRKQAEDYLDFIIKMDKLSQKFIKKRFRALL
jgi:hypothetical protein